MAASAREDLDAYLQTEWLRFGGTGAVFRGAQPRRMIGLWLWRTQALWQHLTGSGTEVPGGFLAPYVTPLEQMAAAGVPHKYRLRGYNMLREMARLRRLDPALLRAGGPPLSLLDLSSGSCAAGEVLRHFGHAVRLADHFPDGVSRYGLHHQELGFAVTPFDGRQRPFGFADRSVDYVTAFQAVDFWGGRGAETEVLHELLRVARRGVMAIFNCPETGPREAAAARMKARLSPAFPGALFTACADSGLPAIFVSV